MYITITQISDRITIYSTANTVNHHLGLHRPPTKTKIPIQFNSKHQDIKPQILAETQSQEPHLTPHTPIKTQSLCHRIVGGRLSLFHITLVLNHSTASTTPVLHHPASARPPPRR